MLPPRASRDGLILREFIGGAVVQPREVSKLIERDRLGLDAELVLQLAHRRALRAEDAAVRDALGSVHLGGFVPVERVRAAGVGPQRRERGLGARALRQEELVVRAEEEDAERSVEQAAGLFGDEPVRRVLLSCPTMLSLSSCDDVDDGRRSQRVDGGALRFCSRGCCADGRAERTHHEDAPSRYMRSSGCRTRPTPRSPSSFSP